MLGRCCYCSEFARMDDLARLATFASWPSTAVSSVTLARSGFKYIWLKVHGRGESTVCVQCQLDIDSWQSGDRPDQVHRQRSPSCLFVRDQLAGSDVLRPAADSCMLRTAAQASTQLQSTISLFLSRRPKHPHFASEQCRVESFTFTGAQIPRGQSVEILAKAGFFYEGPGDKVLCYYCDGGLKNWRA